MERLKPLMKLMSSNKKKMVLRDENINPDTLQSSGSKAILWTCTISAPDMTIVLFNLSGFPIYHVVSYLVIVLLNDDRVFLEFSVGCCIKTASSSL